MTDFRLILIVAAGLALFAACAPPEPAPEPEMEPAAVAPVEPEESQLLVATAVLAGREGSELTGEVTFTQQGETVTIAAQVAGAPAGAHGFHIHETGDCSAEDFTSAGGHFNPGGTAHGAPTDAERHAGDLGNIDVAEDGTGTLELSSDLVSVEAGESSVVGLAVIVHEQADDLVSQPTGAAGARIACGVIELATEEPAAEEPAAEEPAAE